jgi:secreted trypsin-like serine protease
MPSINLFIQRYLKIFSIIALLITSSSANSIIGGNISEDHDKWSWTVGIFYFNYPEVICAGTLLSPKWVITAAHCVEKQTRNNIIVRHGIYDLRHKEEGIQLSVSKIILHPQYKQATYGGAYSGDIALIELANPVPLKRTQLTPFLLDNVNLSQLEGITASVIGWGLQRNRPNLPPIQQEVIVPIVKNTVCSGNISNLVFPNTMICAGDRFRSSGLSIRDGGGNPLVINRNNQWYLIGVSIAPSIALSTDNGGLGLYTSILDIKSFILANTDVGEWMSRPRP